MRYLIKLLKLIPSIIKAIPLILFILSLTTGDSPNTLGAVIFIVGSGTLLFIQIYILHKKYLKENKPKRQRCKDYSKDFNDLYFRFEVIPPPKRHKQFRQTQSICYLVDGNGEFKIKRIIGKKVLINNENV